MAQKKLVSEGNANIADQFIDAEVDLIVDTQFLIQSIMNDAGYSRADLAKKAGISRARLTQLMRAEANPTLRTVARLFAAMDEKVVVGKTKKKGAADAGKPVEQSWQSTQIDDHRSKVPANIGRVIEEHHKRLRDLASATACNENGFVEPEREIFAAAA